MQKFITLNNGELSLDNGIQSSAGIADAGRVLVSNTNGYLDQTLLPDTRQIIASQSLPAGSFVNVWSNSGTANVRLASALGFSYVTHGFVLNSYNSGDVATVYFSGSNNAITGATPGNIFISTTPGGFSSVSPDPSDSANSGKIIQKIGIATSSTNINFVVLNPIGIS